MEDDQEQRPESLLPYDDWIEAAMRQVVAQAMAHVAANGLPGEHHFYITFRTDHPGVVIPPRLRAQYPAGDDHRPAAPVLGPEDGHEARR